MYKVWITKLQYNLLWHIPLLIQFFEQLQRAWCFPMSLGIYTLQNTQTKTKKAKPSSKLKILNINFQSVVNKVPEFHCLIDTEKPYVVIGTESWLSPDISDNGIFPFGYTQFRMDRKSKTSRSGGVFIMVRDGLICTEQSQFNMNCELIWGRLTSIIHRSFLQAKRGWPR